MSDWPNIYNLTGSANRARAALQSWGTTSIALPSVSWPFSLDDQTPTIAETTPTPEFRGHAAAIQSIRASDEFILSGPYETGKTFAALWLLYTLLSTYPRSRAAMLRKVRSDLDGNALETWKTILELRGQVDVYGGQTPRHYTFPNGARLYIGGLDNPGKTLSGERDFIYVNQAEELTEEDWQTISTRATGRSARAIGPDGVPIGLLFGDCNPGPADHWIIRRRDAQSLRLLPTTHQDNPTLYTADGALTARGEQTMRKLQKLSGTQRRRGLLGEWVGAEGQYFETWDEDVHVIDARPFDRNWLFWGALDYGFAHPLAFGVFGLDTLGDVHLMGEWVAHKRLIPEHTAAMDGLLARLGLRRSDLREVVAGHDCWAERDDGQKVETIADKFKRQGWELTQATIDRINGWQAMQTRLGRPSDPDRPIAPSFYVWRACVRTIATIPSLPHDPKRPEDVKKIDADDEGRRGDDCGDMVRYGLMAVPGMPDNGFSLPYDGKGHTVRRRR